MAANPVEINKDTDAPMLSGGAGSFPLQKPSMDAYAKIREHLEGVLGRFNTDRSLNSVVIDLSLDLTDKSQISDGITVASSEDANAQVDASNGSLLKVDLLLSYVDKDGAIKVSGTRSVLDEYDETNPDHGSKLAIYTYGFDPAQLDEAILKANEGTAPSSPLLDSLNDEELKAEPVVNSDALDEGYSVDGLEPPPIDSADPGYDEANIPPTPEDMMGGDLGFEYPQESHTATPIAPSIDALHEGPEQKQEPRSKEGAGQKQEPRSKEDPRREEDFKKGLNENDEVDQEKRTPVTHSSVVNNHTVNKGPGVIANFISAMTARAERNEIVSQRKAEALKADNYRSSVSALDENLGKMDDLVTSLAKTKTALALDAVAKTGVSGDELARYAEALADDPEHEDLKDKIAEAISEDGRLVEHFITKADAVGVDNEKALEFIEAHSDTLDGFVDRAEASAYDDSFADRVRRSAARIKEKIERVLVSLNLMKPTQEIGASITPSEDSIDPQGNPSSLEDLNAAASPLPPSIDVDDSMSPNN
jgi:hypothetical protein